MASAVLMQPDNRFGANNGRDYLTPKFQLLSLGSPPAASSSAVAVPTLLSSSSTAANVQNGSPNAGGVIRGRKSRTSSQPEQASPQPALINAALHELHSLQRDDGNRGGDGQNSNFRLLQFPDAPSANGEVGKLPFLHLTPFAGSQTNFGNGSDASQAAAGPRVFLLPPELVLGHMQRHVAPPPKTRVQFQFQPQPQPAQLASPSSLPLLQFALPSAQTGSDASPSKTRHGLPFLQPPSALLNMSSLRTAVPRCDAASGSLHDAAIQSAFEEEEDLTVPINDANIDELLEQINAGFVLKPGTIADLLLKPRRARSLRSRSAFSASYERDSHSYSFDESELDWRPAPIAARPVRLVNVVDLDDEVEKHDRQKPLVAMSAQSFATPVHQAPAPTVLTKEEPASADAPKAAVSEAAAEQVAQAEPPINGALERIRRALSEIESRRDADAPEAPAVHPYVLRPDNIDDVVANRYVAPTPAAEQPKRTTLRFADELHAEPAQQKAALTAGQRSILKNTLRDQPPTENVALAVALREADDDQQRQRQRQGQRSEERSETDARRTSAAHEAKRNIARALADMNASLNSIAALERSASLQMADVQANTSYRDAEGEWLTRPSVIFRKNERPEPPPAPLHVPVPAPRMVAYQERIVPESALLSTDASVSHAELRSNDATAAMSDTQLANAEQEMTLMERERLDRKEKLRLRIERILKGEAVSPRVPVAPRTHSQPQNPPAATAKRERAPDIFEVHRRERERQRNEAIAKRETTAVRLINDLLDAAPSAPRRSAERDAGDAMRRSTEWIASDVRGAVSKEKTQTELAVRAKRRILEGAKMQPEPERVEDSQMRVDAVQTGEKKALSEDFVRKVEAARRERVQRKAAPAPPRDKSPTVLDKIKSDQKERLHQEENTLRRTTIMYRTQPLRSAVRATPYDRPALKSRSSSRDQVDAADTVSEVSEWSVDPRVSRLLFDGASATDVDTRSEFSVDQLDAVPVANPRTQPRGRQGPSRGGRAAPRAPQYVTKQQTVQRAPAQPARPVGVGRTAQSAGNVQARALPPPTDRSVASTLDSEMIEQYLHGDAETERLLGVGGAGSRSVTTASVGDVDELADAISIDTPGSIIDWNEVEQLVGNK